MRTLFMLAAAFAAVAPSTVVQLPMHRGTRSSSHSMRTEQIGLNGDTNNSPITEYFDGYYLTNITLGTPPQSFSVMLDTATSNLWVINSSCKKERCQRWRTPVGGSIYKDYRNLFNPSSSSTFNSTGKTFRLTSNSGTYSGSIGKDVISVGGLNYATQDILVADEISEDFADMPIDGVLGLAWPALAVQNVVPVMQNLLPQLDRKLFTIWLDRHKYLEPALPGGLITYGAHDSVNCDAQIGWVGLSSKTYWQFPINTFTFGKYSKSGTQQAFSNTGSPLIEAPTAAFNAIVAATGATFSRDTEYGEVSCTADYPDLIFNIAGVDYTITPSEYVIALYGHPYCYLAVRPYNGGGGFAPDWMLGDPFIRAYCNVFDIGNARIGFARAHHAEI